MAGLLEETLANKMSTNDNYTPRLVLMVYGKHSLNEEQVVPNRISIFYLVIMLTYFAVYS